MRIIDLFQLSIANLLKRKVRTLLTVLGVVIGTTSIVVMVSLGIGLKESVIGQLEDYASLTNIEVTPMNNYDSSNSKKKPTDGLLSDATIEEFKQLEHVVDVSPQLSTSIIIKAGQYSLYTDLVGLTQKTLKEKKLEFEWGDLPTSDKEISFIIGNTIPMQMYIEKSGVYPYYDQGKIPDVDFENDKIAVIYDTEAYNSAGTKDASGKVIKKPKKYIANISGLLVGGTEKWTRDSYRIYCDLDALIYQLKLMYRTKPIPGQPTTKKGKPYKEIYYSQLNIEVDDMENVSDVTQVITDMGYYASNDAEWIQSEMKQMNSIQMVLGAIGAVSLLVAAIGITNTMMMSIYERTKEIGVMKVLGCDMRNIQEMFLIEAGFIGFLGGMVGVAFSYGLSALINHFSVGNSMGIENISRIPLWLPLPSIGFAILIGMVAGFFPSLRAMKLSPLAAIHSE